MKRLFYYSTALLILFAAIYTTASADPGDFGRGGGRGGHFMHKGNGCDGHGQCGMRGGKAGQRPGMGIKMILKHGEEISLTDKQETELKKLSETFQFSKIDKKAELEKGQVELRILRMEDNPSEADVLAAMDKVGNLKTDMQKMQYSHRAAIKKVLTDDQRAKLKELVKRGMDQRFGDGRGKMKLKGKGAGRG